jgi:glycine oxidase
MLAPGGELEEASPLTKMALRSLAQYPGFVAELQDASGISIDYQRCGAIDVALTMAEADTLERRSTRQSELGIHSEIATYSGSVSARFYPSDHVVAPRDVTAALEATCLRAGVEIRANESVTQLGQDGAVTTQLGQYHSDGIVIAAGAWSSTLFPNLPLTMPVRGHLVSWDINRALLSTIVRHEGTYLLQRSKGTVIAGSSTEYVGFDRRIDERVVRDIHERASRLLPGLASLSPSARWNGFRPGVAGDMPVIGRIEGTLIWTAFGHYRNGILLAPETARVIANMVTGTLG